MSLHVIEPGLFTLVVDLGRPRTRRLGVPVGGPADRASLILGNALVGNAPDVAALEITLAGPTLRSDTELACVVHGAPFQLNGSRHQPPHSLKAGTTFTLAAGEELQIGGTAVGSRAYLCVRGGLSTPEVLGSRTALEPLKAGQELPCAAGAIRQRSIHRRPVGGGDLEPLRVLAGSQAEWFEADPFYGETFTVTPASNRMGLRLQGPPLRPRNAAGDATAIREMVSEPVCPGAVQVTRDGQCIILGVDGQTIGGYPKIAHVISADLDTVGQLRPGQRVRFAPVTLGQAEAAFREREADLREWVTRLLVASGE